jgi:hypothetical protein
MNLSVTLHAKDKNDLAKQLRQWAEHLVGSDGPTDEPAEDIDADVAAETEVDEDDEFGASTKKKAAKKKAAAAFEDDEKAPDEEPAEESFDDEEEEKPAKKVAAKKTKELAEADVMKACKAHAKENGPEATQKLLLKTFKTKSVSKIKPEQYAQAVKLLAV